ncbi:MAG: hypothetical protein ACPGDD_03290 [Poseidonia sp.]
MDDKYDLVGFFLSKDGLLRSGIIGLLEGTPLEESAGSLSFAIATFAVVNVVFLMLFFSQFAILWIERKAVARMQDRYGATTALRSLWVGENGVTAGEWWNMLPFGLGKPIGAVNKWLNKNFGNRDENFATVDRVNNRSWMGKTIVPGFFQNVADGQVELEVSDEGVGLPPDMDFAKNDSLGVYLVQALTEQIDGELVVTSTNEGRKGCSFLVRFTPTK